MADEKAALQPGEVVELFVEDYEKLISATSKSAAITAGDRKFVEDTKPSLLQG